MGCFLPHAMSTYERVFPVAEYDLAATLTSGQAFRWNRLGDTWEGVVGRRWVRLVSSAESIHASVAVPSTDWSWLTEYLQLDLDLTGVLTTFPGEPQMERAVAACRGLRLLRQDVWECLASFILSSTKQIVQIRQVVDRLCRRFGEPITVPSGVIPHWSFPDVLRIASLSECELRACGMGFRAPYLRESARLIGAGEISLAGLPGMSLEQARAELMKLPGVGRKIADCVLLFAGGHATAFPVDIWILKTLRELYFGGKNIPMRQVLKFVESHFGPNAGYAQQYLFHAARSESGKVLC